MCNQIDFEDRQTPEQKLMTEALFKFGEESQKWQTVEELAELILAICHHRRGRVQDVDVVEELVDSSLMIEQMRRVFDKKHTDFDRFRAEKLLRLKELLK